MAAKKLCSHYYHYSIGQKRLVSRISIFVELGYSDGIHIGEPLIDALHIPSLLYSNAKSYDYFINYILDDLYYLGYINEYEKVSKAPLTIYTVTILKLAISKFVVSAGLAKDLNLLEGTLWTVDMERKLSDMVSKKYENDQFTSYVKYEHEPTESSADKNNISWDSYFIGIAKLVRLRSKDPCCKVGACIVRNNKVLSTGYNGFPRNIDDDKYPWGKDSDNPVNNKFFYVVHAELNAILNSDNPVNGSTLYVTKFPCNECAKAIIQSGITKVIYDDNKSDENIFSEDVKIYSKKLLNDAGIECCRYTPIGEGVIIDL